MLTVDNLNQYIDWWHEVLPGSGETFDHEGSLTSVVFSPALTIGLSNYWNVSLSQIIGNRTMVWEGDTTTIHHRDEGSHTNFINAVGGFLGDTRLLFRYLFYNDGQGAGKRFFIGGGLVLPSKNTITSDPFFLNGEEKSDHRHFALSEGAYKGIFELQFFKKRNTNPVFIGGTITTEQPLNTNKHGYLASRFFDLSFSALSKEFSKLGFALSTSAVIRHSTQAFWNEKPAPNSRSTMLTLGLGLIWNLKVGGVAINLQRPFFLDGRFSGIEGDVEQRVSAYQISLSYRKLFDYVIPWLDPLKDI